MSDDAVLTSHAELNRRIWDEQAREYEARHGGQLEKSGGTAWPMEHIWRLRREAG